MADAAAPRFSILLPTHNRSDVLRLSIASILAQSESDFELLVVADGCTDGTKAIVEAFADRRIRFFDLPKAPGFGYANRNVALRQARGTLVAIAAHDDLWLPDHLRLMGELLKTSGSDWGYSRPVMVSTDGTIVPYATNLLVASEMDDFQIENTLAAASVVHTYEALERAGFWPENVDIAGDWVLWRRIIANSSQSVAYLRQPTNLHFSADWKKSRYSSSREVEWLLTIADAAAWWPPILRHETSPGTEQAVVWEAMQAHPNWTRDFRAAIEDVIDRVYWMLVRDNTMSAIADRASLVPSAADHRLTEVLRKLWSNVVPGPLRGGVDVITADGIIFGWAQDMNHPLVPVLLDIVVDGAVICAIAASLFREDLARAGVNDGCYAFVHKTRLPIDRLAGLSVRRQSDGVELAIGAMARLQLSGRADHAP